MKFRLLNDPSRQRLWTTKTTNRLVNSSIRSTNASLRMSSKRRSNYFSAPTFYPTTIYQLATSENFQSPTCLHSSCPYPTPVISRCHLPLENVKTTHGRSFMGRHFILLSKSSLKARSDQPTGPIIETFNVATCQPSGHSTLAGKYPTVTRPYPRLGGERATRCYPKERKRTARYRHRGDVSRINQPHRIQSWRQ